MSEAYDEGRRAFTDGKPKSKNPYPDASGDWWEWNIGWATARQCQKENEEAA